MVADLVYGTSCLVAFSHVPRAWPTPAKVHGDHRPSSIRTRSRKSHVARDSHAPIDKVLLAHMHTGHMSCLAVRAHDKYIK